MPRDISVLDIVAKYNVTLARIVDLWLVIKKKLHPLGARVISMLFLVSSSSLKYILCIVSIYVLINL